MHFTEIEKSKVFTTASILEYGPDEVNTQIILKKLSGDVSILSFGSGEGLALKTKPFDTFMQMVDGEAELVINGLSYVLTEGQCIIIPAHAPNYIKPNGRFKIMLTVIKSGYEAI